MVEPKDWLALISTDIDLSNEDIVRIYGKRRHCSAELAKEWILHGLPRYDIPYEYVLFKPLSQTDSDENIRAVIFPVNPVELSCLVTLAGSVMQGTDSVRVAQGDCCNSIRAFCNIFFIFSFSSSGSMINCCPCEGKKIPR